MSRGRIIFGVFVLLQYFQSNFVASLQHKLLGSFSIPGGASSKSMTLGMRFSQIRSTSFLTSSSLLRKEFQIDIDEYDNSISVYSSISYARRRATICMGKGDGKKRRPKKSASSSPAPTPTPSQPAAPRVSNDINIPIRRQIQYGRMNKQFRESGSTSFRQKKKVVRTKYRRTWDEEEIEQKAEERRRKGQDPDWDVILNRTSTAPLVIVDGYNIIYKWPRLKKHMVKGDPSRARQLLIDDLENLGSMKGWRIECVFDGARRSNNGPLGDTRQKASAADRAAKKDVTKHGIRTVFTGNGVEADSYIEARCAEAKSVTTGAITGTFIVATDDAMIRIAGVNAGALCMSADRFVSELKAVKKSVAYRVEAAMAKVNGDTMRPEKLWGTSVFTGTSTENSASTKTPHAKAGALDKSSGFESLPNFGDSNRVQQTEDGKTIYRGRFGRGALIIEDKRKKKPKKNGGGGT